MATYVYAPTIYKGTRELIAALDAKRLVRFDGMTFLHKGKPLVLDPANDVIICWGACVPPMDGFRVLNSHPIFTSYLHMNMNMHIVREAGGFIPLPIYQVPRLSKYPTNIISIDDVQYGNIVPSRDFPGYATNTAHMPHEFEVHVFGDQVLRVGKKVPLFPLSGNGPLVEGRSHPWHKASSSGWKISYEVRNDLTKFKKNAAMFLETAELTFGVLSIGCANANGEMSYDYRSYVRKLCTAPELDDAGVTMYAVKIKEWIRRSA